MLDELKDEKMKLQDAYMKTRGKYYDASEKLIKHGTTDDELGLLYTGITNELERDLQTAKSEFDVVVKDIINIKKELDELEKNKICGNHEED